MRVHHVGWMVLWLRWMDGMRGRSFQCQSTASGSNYIADDEGKVCNWMDRDPNTACCRSGEKYTCGRCTEEGCCDVYEQCVSCCLGRMEPSEWNDRRQLPSRPGVGKWNTPFELCNNVCRTNANMTVHENAYRSAFRFCFNHTGRHPSRTQQESNTIDPTITFVAGVTGQNCDDACRKVKKKCQDDILEQANDCSLLRRHFGCTGKCSFGRSPWMPAFAPGNHPHEREEYVCTLRMGSRSDCSSMSFNSDRMCACKG
mmetsp:Transcript_7697/g.47605  ORF Transcript_7697/g.47605 Transcript_7697/m.47605 type:complete len:257 (-) Transcript_7697:2645-3415(-)